MIRQKGLSFELSQNIYIFSKLIISQFFKLQSSPSLIRLMKSRDNKTRIYQDQMNVQFISYNTHPIEPEVIDHEHRTTCEANPSLGQSLDE